MTEYALFVESGPKMRKTQAHVLGLLGCVVNGPATDEALARAPGAIREYLMFLRRHGENVDPDAPVTTRVVQHVTEGYWVGNGDPVPGFTPDFAPLSMDDLNVGMRRMIWMLDDLLDQIRPLTPERLSEEPETGRSIIHILDHVTNSQANFVRYQVGKVDGLAEALKQARAGPESAVDGLALVFGISRRRFENLTPEERAARVQHGQVTWTASRGLRRMLEHLWEHKAEIERRLRE